MAKILFFLIVMASELVTRDCRSPSKGVGHDTSISCTDDSDCVSLGYKFGCFLYKCINYVDSRRQQCSADMDCPLDQLCHRHQILRIKTGLCFPSSEMSACNSTSDCLGNHLTSCCGDWCCPQTFFSQWEEKPCFSNLECRTWNTGQFCCPDNRCCQSLPSYEDYYDYQYEYEYSDTSNEATIGTYSYMDTGGEDSSNSSFFDGVFLTQSKKDSVKNTSDLQEEGIIANKIIQHVSLDNSENNIDTDNEYPSYSLSEEEDTVGLSDARGEVINKNIPEPTLFTDNDFSHNPFLEETFLTELESDLENTYKHSQREDKLDNNENKNSSQQNSMEIWSDIKTVKENIPHDQISFVEDINETILAIDETSETENMYFEEDLVDNKGIDSNPLFYTNTGIEHDLSNTLLVENENWIVSESDHEQEKNNSISKISGNSTNLFNDGLSSSVFNPKMEKIDASEYEDAQEKHEKNVLFIKPNDSVNVETSKIPFETDQYNPQSQESFVDIPVPNDNDTNSEEFVSSTTLVNEGNNIGPTLTINLNEVQHNSSMEDITDKFSDTTKEDLEISGLTLPEILKLPGAVSDENTEVSDKTEDKFDANMNGNKESSVYHSQNVGSDKLIIYNEVTNTHYNSSQYIPLASSDDYVTVDEIGSGQDNSTIHNFVYVDEIQELDDINEEHDKLKKLFDDLQGKTESNESHTDYVSPNSQNSDSKGFRFVVNELNFIFMLALSFCVCSKNIYI